MAVNKKYQNQTAFKKIRPQNGWFVQNKSINWVVMSIRAVYFHKNPQRISLQLALKSFFRPTT